MKELKCGTESEARGRNGWFKPAAIVAFESNDGAIWLSVRSKRASYNAPIQLVLSPADARGLQGLLQELLGCRDGSQAKAGDN